MQTMNLNSSRGRNQVDSKGNRILDWKNIFIMFLIGCVVGTFYEEIVHFIKYGNYEPRRALVWGPFNPLYGIGFVVFVIFLYPTWDKRTKFQNFLACALLGGTTELMSSVITEALFGIKAWDYSNHFMNVFGKTTIPFALFWGLAGYIIVQYIYPYLSKKLSYILSTSKKKFCTIMVIFMAFNISATVLIVYRHVSRVDNRESNSLIFQTIDLMYGEEFIKEKFPNWIYESE